MKAGTIFAVVFLMMGVCLAGQAGENLLRNSSFETCTTEKLPDFWGPGGMGISSAHWQVNMDEWRTRWGVDDTVSHSGKHSLRIDCPGDATDLIAYARWVDLPVLNVPWTLSVWLKADREEMPVGFNYQFGSSQVKVGKEWTRFSVTSSPYDKTQTVIVSPGANGVIWIDDVQFEQGDAATDYAPAPADAGITGEAVHRMVADVPAFKNKPGGTRPASVRIDENRRFLVEGTPFIPFGPGFSNLPTTDLLKKTAAAGFSAVVLLLGNDEKIEDIRRCLDEANLLGMKVVGMLRNPATVKTRATIITSFRSHPAVIAWYVTDEPDGDHQYVKDFYSMARKLDPSRPVYVNYAPSFYFPEALPTDIASLDRYDIGAEPDGPIYQAEFTDQLEKVAVTAGKPSWIWLQSGGYAYWMSRSPTAPEQEAMVYLTLVHGVRGIKFWVDLPFSLEEWRTMKMLAQEVRQLTPILYSLETAPTVSAIPSDRLGIHVTAKTYKGKRYIIACNAGPKPVDATITISTGGESANVLFEKRRVKVDNGVIKDNFLGYQRHAYEVSR